MATVIIVLFALLVLTGVLRTIATVGKTQKPVTPGVAATVAFLGMVELAALAYLSTQV